MTRTAAAPERAAAIVILAGVAGALHVAKLPPAISALQAALGLSLLQAGFLLSLVQFAGMSAGVAFGVLADGLGLKRSMLIGLGLLAAASVLGALAQAVPWLMALRALEGFGFLLVVLPAPGLVRRLVPPQHLSRMLGFWGSYMPFGTALALLAGPVWIGAFGWRSWWWLLGGISLAMALWLARAVPDAPAAPDVPAPAAAAGGGAGWWQRLRRTLAAPGPWLVALTFAVYSGQWLAVIGFLPTIYLRAGVSGVLTGVLTALAAAVNMLGNVAAGRLQHAGVAPARLLNIGFAAMGVAAVAAYAEIGGHGLPAALRYTAVLAFSMFGGLIPATLFSLALLLAPGEGTLSSTIGWVQQWSAFGQFAGPPLVAWVAGLAGGWHWTWAATGSCALLGLLLVTRIARLLRQRAAPR
ncbi:MAG TPA: MFS transporter [Rubrivivax sp.]|nr:MFS transporter [Rubrivivax sp.]